MITENETDREEERSRRLNVPPKIVSINQLMLTRRASLTDNGNDQTDSRIGVHSPFVISKPDEQTSSDDTDVSELMIMETGQFPTNSGG